MRPSDGHSADWKDAAAYAPLLQVGRTGFAWEWLRRDMDYRAAAFRTLTSISALRFGGRGEGHGLAAKWGLHAFEWPDRDALEARPVWRRDIYPYVLRVAAVDAGRDDDRLDLGRLEPLVTLLTDPGGPEHLLLSDGGRNIRVDIVSGTLRAGPARLHYDLQGFLSIREPLLVVRQLVALRCNGKFSPALHPPERRARRLIMLLRTQDALIAGASQREIAGSLFGLAPTERRWRVRAASLRSRAQRLVRDARRMAAEGYLSLLQGR